MAVSRSRATVSGNCSSVVLDAEIDAYIADPQFRKRDPRFADQQAHKAKTTDREQTSKARKYFTADEFTFNDEGVLIAGRESR